MSQYFLIRCDAYLDVGERQQSARAGDLCGKAFFYTHALSHEEAQAEARALGWDTPTGGPDYCPEHARKDGEG